MIYANVLKSVAYREGELAMLSDCSNSGISSKFDRLLALGPNEPVPVGLGVGLEHQLIRIVPHYAGLIRAVPVQPSGEPVKSWLMMGGNFLHSSDSRFREACDEALALSYQGNAVKNGQLVPAPALPAGVTFYGAVAIHDRIEG